MENKKGISPNIDEFLSTFPMPPRLILTPSSYVKKREPIGEDNENTESDEYSIDGDIDSKKNTKESFHNNLINEPILDHGMKVFYRFCKSRAFPSTEQQILLKQSFKGKTDKEIRQIQEKILQALAEESPLEAYTHESLLKGAKSIWKYARRSISENVTGIINQEQMVLSNTIEMKKESWESESHTVASYPDLRLDKYGFIVASKSQKGHIDPGKVYKQSINLRNIGVCDSSYHWKWTHIDTKDCSITFSPTRGIVTKGQQECCEILLKVNKPKCEIEELVVLEVPGGHRMAVLIKATTCNSFFAVPPQQLEFVNVEVNKSQDEISVPKFLEDLRQTLRASGGLKEKGIFRRAASVNEVELMKQELNTTGSITNTNPICISSMMKAWFRELPEPILGDISHDNIIACNTAYDLSELISHNVSIVNLHLFVWLMKLLNEVVAHESENSMSATNCAIIFVPNLIQMEGIESALVLKTTQHLASILVPFILQKISIFDSLKK